VKGLAIFCMLLLLLTGAVGLKTKSDCASLIDAEKLSCYHLAALTKAYTSSSDSDLNSAQGLCNDIFNDIGMNHSSPQDDVYIRAETERNLCLFDIAKIIARYPGKSGDAENICKGIVQTNYSSSMTGAKVTQDVCLSDVKRIAKITPESYYTSGQNMCSVIFVLPMIIVAAFFFRNRSGS